MKMRGMVIREVTIDACIARKSIEHNSLAPDMQSLPGVSSSAGSLLGYLSSGFFVHKLGAQEALGLLTVSLAAMLFLGVGIYELRIVTKDQGSSEKKFLWSCKPCLSCTRSTRTRSTCLQREQLLRLRSSTYVVVNDKYLSKLPKVPLSKAA